MAWVCMDDRGGEWLCEDKLVKEVWQKTFSIWDIHKVNAIYLPKGSIKKLIGRELSWQDEPVELKEDGV